MGVANVKLTNSVEQLQTFERHILSDIHAMDKMLKEGWFEIDKIRIGAEQEFCLVDKYSKPIGKSIEMMEHLDEQFFTTELARFNMEINATPREFKNTCLSDLENEISKNYNIATKVAEEMGIHTILSGIVPTIRKSDFTMDNLTPFDRYQALCDAINMIRGEHFQLKIEGIDELISNHDTPLLEAANTGFQVHLQIKPDEFVDMYNISQAITGPVLSSATNSPFLFGKRLWKETRIALFTQSVDTRVSHEYHREVSPRVTFGDNWIKDSILDIYKEDLVRYRVLLNAEITENVFETLESGKAPKLMALQVHNGTVYRWNRPCYGVGDNGKAHLRIENRVLPAGPTIVDSIANSALWLGLMVGMKNEYGDITKKLEFDDVKSNFLKASINGLDTKFNWFDNKKIQASDLLLKELIPLAEEGLKDQNVSSDDITKYTDILKERAESGRTGSYWMLESYSKLKKNNNKEEVLAAITAATIKNQKTMKPVHKWELARLEDNENWKPSEIMVEEFMTQKLFTVQKDDIIELVSEMMDWKKIRYVVVENEKGKLVGLVTSRTVLRAYMKTQHQNSVLPKTVNDIMIKSPLTITATAKLTEAMELMTEHQIGCLPVVDKDNHLIGVVTEENFLEISRRLVNRLK
ncbi:MAG: CBS domain-containing protein [Planctomycetota bacterium]|jgi:CBS domain-containing protein